MTPPSPDPVRQKAEELVEGIVVALSNKTPGAVVTIQELAKPVANALTLHAAETEAELAILKQALANANKLYGELADELAVATSSLAQSQEALRTYGRHLDWPPCEVYADKRPCTCGLDAVLSATKDNKVDHPRKKR